jgi:hypothetical protein
MKNAHALLRAHAQHDADRAIARRRLYLPVHLASLGAVLYKCNMLTYPLETTLKIAVAAIAVVLLLGLLLTYEVMVWRECLSDQSWWYCLRILG